MRRGIALLGFVVAVATAAVAAMFVGHGPSTASASSHSEAPLISQDPRADNTDLYAFVSPDDTNKVTFVANYIPLESCGQRAELPELRRHRSLRDQDRQLRGRQGRHRLPVQVHDDDAEPGHVPLQHGPDHVARATRTGTGRRPTASTLVHFKKDGKVEERGKNGPVVLVDNAWTPPDNIGPRSTPNYDALAAAAVTPLPGGGKVFAGQRDDPFFVDLGSIFDLAGLRPFNPFHLIPLAADAGCGRVEELQHALDRAPDPDRGRRSRSRTRTSVIYASASRSERTILKKDGTTKSEGQFVQVSRLGNPLINEVLIPLGQKDIWNRSEPEDDSSFANRYTTSEVAHLQNVLYGTRLRPRGRGAGEHRRDGPHRPLADPADRCSRAELHRRHAVRPAPPEHGAQAGRQRRVPGRHGLRGALRTASRCSTPTSAASRTAAGSATTSSTSSCGRSRQGYGTFLNGAFGLPNKSPNNLLGDGVDANDVPVLEHVPVRGSTAPGLRRALSGLKERAGGQPAGCPPASGQRSEQR